MIKKRNGLESQFLIENIIKGYWVFGLLPLSGILMNTNEHNVSETGSVSVPT
jgi:hypothetical protein